MPVLNRFYLMPNAPAGTPNFHFGPLFALGPRLPIEIHVPTALAKHLSQNGQPVPAPLSGWALIDTGASVTCVDANAIQSLGVQPVGVVNVGTPSTAGTPQNQYPVRLVFPGSPLPGLETMHAIGSVLQPQKLLALIGRDALASLVLVYNGPGGFITLAI